MRYTTADTQVNIKNLLLYRNRRLNVCSRTCQMCLRPKEGACDSHTTRLHRVAINFIGALIMVTIDAKKHD